jgi:hypothetical protein
LQKFLIEENFRLAVLPEGTRKKVSEIQDFIIALKANVPITLLRLILKKEVNLELH